MKKWLKRGAVAMGVVALVSLCSAGWLAYQLTARVPGHYFDSNGLQIYYTDEGAGEPVILVHGLAANADLNWRRAGITGQLAKEFRVVALDLRGHGLSGKSQDPKDYGIEMARDVVRLMDHLKIERAHIAGYSLGGFIALKCVSAFPDRFISAAYCASGWKDPDGPEDILSPYRRPETKQSRVEHDGTVYELAHADAGRFTDGPIDWIKDAVGDRIVDRKSVRAMKTGFRDLIVTKEQLASIKTPGICFIGTNDGLKPYADDLHRMQPSIELVVLDGANHITTVMYGEFKDRLQSFFRDHTAQAPPTHAANS